MSFEPHLGPIWFKDLKTCFFSKISLKVDFENFCCCNVMQKNKTKKNKNKTKQNKNKQKKPRKIPLMNFL